ncbi:MAG: class I SAM-dependent methyltransferase [Patescibacteria group bacterium]
MRKKIEGDRAVTQNLRGDILEVGAGDGSRKAYFLATQKNIRRYLATDCADWDREFEHFNQLNKKWGKLAEIFFGYSQRIKLDNICSATSLPHNDNSFDAHLSFEVLEHINNPLKYFLEATRVVKPGGKIIFSSPFLYRMHGGDPDHRLDYFRYAQGFFYYIAEKNHLKVVKIVSNTGYGTTLAAMTNQWLVCRIKNGNPWMRIFLFLIAPPPFF